MSPSVLVVGATGHLGFPIACQLAAAGNPTAALVRAPSDASNPDRTAKLQSLREAGVDIIEGDVTLDKEELTAILRPCDTVVCTLAGPDMIAGQLALIEAASAAGVRRFFPSDFGADGGVLSSAEHAALNVSLRRLIDGKERVSEALAESGMEWTRVVSYVFFGFILPKLGTLGAPTPLPDPLPVYAGGNTQGVMTDEEDIAKVVVRAVADPRTANKKLVIRAIMPTQNEIINTWERLTGKPLSRKDVSTAELEALCQSAEGMMGFFWANLKALWSDGYYKREPAGPVVLATELYPDLRFKSVEEYLRQLL